jgi:hypothetical protein
MEVKAPNGNIHTYLLADIEPALHNNPEAAHAFAVLMWMIRDAVRDNPECAAHITPLIDASINLAYEYTSDHRIDHEASLERFRRVLADECGTK